MVVRELFAKFGLQFDSASLKKVEAGILSVKNSALVLTGALAGIGTGFYALVHSAAGVGEELFNTSQKVGLTVESLQRLRYAAKSANIDQDSFNRSLIFFNNTLAEARNGSKTAVESFKKLGLDPKMAKMTEETFLKIATRIQGLTDVAQKTNLLRGIFGKEGANFIPLLNQGADGIAALMEKASAMGLITQEQAAAAEAFNSALGEMKYQIGNLKNLIGIAFIPTFKSLIEKINKWLMQNRVLLRQRFEYYLKLLVILFTRVGQLVGRIGSAFNAFAKAVGGAKNALIILGTVAVGVGLAFGFLNPVILLVGLLAAALLLIYDDYKSFGEGKKTFFAWGEIIPRVTAAFQFLGDVWRGLKVVLAGLFDAFMMIVRVLDYIGLLKPFKWMWEGLKLAGRLLWFITKIVGKLMAFALFKPFKDLAEIGKSLRVVEPVAREDMTFEDGEQPGPPAGVPLVDRARQVAEGLSGGFDATGQDAMTAQAIKSMNEEAVGTGQATIQKTANNQTNNMTVNNKIDVHVQTEAEPDLIGDAVANKVKEVMDGAFSDGLVSLQPGTQY